MSETLERMATVSAEPAIRLEGVGKMYRVFPSRSANLVDALGLSRLLPSRKSRYEEFWALRGVDFELEKGARLGVIGRNGAGKTTLLKLITGAVASTEGEIETAGTVQALLEASAGLHPEFTGRENIRAALTYQGFNGQQIAEAERDIADFTELASFLEQPFRTYSTGMQARLGFAIATSVQPEILIVDEVLGAGDAYFLTKSIARMTALIEGGASVLMVSHSLDHIVRFCSEAIWLERGEIVERGPALEVVKAYSQFIRELEERKLKSANRRARSNGAGVAPVEHVLVRLRVSGETCDIGAIRLLAGERVEDEVVVGGPQDSDSSHAAALVLEEGESWSAPLGARGESFRTLSGLGVARFETEGLLLDSRHSFEIVYRGGALDVDVLKDGEVMVAQHLVAEGRDWAQSRIQLPEEGATTAHAAQTRAAGATRVRRWPGEGSLMVDAVELLDATGEERAVFDVGTSLTLRIVFGARRSGTFDVVPTAVLYRLDAVLVARFIGERVTLDLEEGEGHEALLRIPELNLGDDDYVFAVALYKTLDIEDIEPSEYYDLLDRNYHFKVVGTPPLLRGIFRHPGSWTVA